MRLFYWFPLLGAVCVSAAVVSVEGLALAFDAKPFVGARPEPETAPENPYHETGDGEPGGSGYHPSTTTDGSNSGQPENFQNVEGTAAQSTSPFDRGEEGNELAEQILEAAKKVLEEIASALAKVAQNSVPTTTIVSIPIFATTTASISAPTSISSSTGPSDNGTYNAAYDLSLPSIDMAKDLAAQGLLHFWSDALTSVEYDMYKSDPLCFYANMENTYSSASASSAASASTGDTSATITSAPSKRSLQARQTNANETCSEFVPGISQCAPISGSPQWSSSLSEQINGLYGTALPDHLYSIHFATPSVSGDVTATVVSSTSCSGLDSGAGPTTSYRELKVSQASAVSTAPAQTSSTPPSSDATKTGSLNLPLSGPLLASLLLLELCQIRI